MIINRYQDEARLRANVGNQGHRGLVGGLWDVIGPRQCEFLISRGLRPDHAMIDIGCGSLRGGLPLTIYLDGGNYYGIDLSPTLIEAGYEAEIVAAGLAEKLPRAHLHVTDDFEIPFGRRFDYALAVSLFTHLTLDYLARCLDRLAPEMAVGGQFYATFFEGDADQPDILWPDGIVSHPDSDPFHFSQAAIRAATPAGWRFDWIGDWGHPRDQRMACFTRV